MDDRFFLISLLRSAMTLFQQALTQKPVLIVLNLCKSIDTYFSIHNNHHRPLISNLSLSLINSPSPSFPLLFPLNIPLNILRKRKEKRKISSFSESVNHQSDQSVRFKQLELDSRFVSVHRIQPRSIDRPINQIVRSVGPMAKPPRKNCHQSVIRGRLLYTAVCTSVMQTTIYNVDYDEPSSTSSSETSGKQ